MMRSKTLPAIALSLACFVIGALLGRRWIGNFADTVLTGIALLALGLIITRMVMPWSPRKRRTPAPETMTERVENDPGKHLIFVRQAEQGKWMLRLQNVLGVQSAEIDISLPQGSLPNRAAIVSFAALIFSSTTFGAIIGRQWKGDTADKVLVGAAILLVLMLAWFARGSLHGFRRAVESSPVDPEQAAAAPRVRFGLLLFLALAIALGAYAQYLFGQQGSVWYDSVMFYFIGALVFILVARRVEPSIPRTRTEFSWLTRSGEWLKAHHLRNAAISFAFIADIVASFDAVRQPLAGNHGAAMGLWLLSVSVFIAAFVPWSRLDGAGARIRAGVALLYQKEITWVAAIVLFAFVLRAYDAGGIPINFGGDEAEMGLQAKLFLDGRLTNPFATSWYSHPTFFFFLQSTSLRIFGEDVFGLRMLSAIIGTLTVLAAYLLVKEFFGRPLAIMSSLLLAAYAYHIQFSRLGMNNVADPFWAVTIFFLVARGLTTPRVGYFVAAGLSLGLSQYFYHGVRLIPVMLVVYLAFWLVPKGRQALEHVGNLVVMVGASILAFLPLLIYFTKYPNLFNERLNQMGVFQSGWLDRVIAQTGKNPILFMLDRTREKFLAFNYVPDISGFYASGTPLLETLSSILFVFGLAYSLYRMRERGYFLFAMWFVLGVVFASVLIIDEAGSARTVTLTVPLMFFAALGAQKIVEFLATSLRTDSKWKWRMAALVVAVIAIVNVKFYFVDYVPKRTYGGYTTRTNTEMANYFLSQPVEFKAYFFGPPYDYLTHGTIRYMVPDLNGMDLINPVKGSYDFVDHTRRAIFLFIAPRANEFPIVQQAFPGGNEFDFATADGELLFKAYEVDF